MNASTLVIVAVIVVLAFFAGRRMFAVYFGNKGCCGGGSTKPYAKKFANATVEDTDESHYPYALELMIGGMTCCNCTRAVENAINSLPDVWAASRSGCRRIPGRCGRLLHHPPSQRGRGELSDGSGLRLNGRHAARGRSCAA